MDISRPFTENKFDEEEDEEEEEETVSENELAKLMKGKTSTVKRKEKRSWQNGKRCLELALFDGKNECLAIEYSHIPILNDNLLGAKVLLVGPFDVYGGVIFMKSDNVRIVSDVTFYPAGDSKTTSQTTTTVSQVPSTQIAEDFSHLMEDDLELDITL